MKEIIEDGLFCYKVINIRKNTPVLEYLKKDYPRRFKLQQVTEEEFELLKKTQKRINLETRNFIAGYATPKDNKIGSSGGLKVSDPSGEIKGSFIIQDKKIIYDAACPFYEERDSSVYGLPTHYTTMSMREIILEELKRKRDYLIYMGTKLDYTLCRCAEQFDNVTKEEFIDYLINPEKGELVRQKRRRCQFIEHID